MNQLKKLYQALEDRYGVDIQKFLHAYEAGATREEIEIATGITTFPIRTIASALNLRWPSKHRINDLALLQSREEEDTSTLADSVIYLKETVAQYEHDLTLKDKSLVRVRREANRLRSEMREEALDDVVIRMVEDALADAPILQVPKFDLKALNEGVDFLMLSDLHAGTTVHNDEVPDNEFNFEILTDRLSVVFTELVSNKTTEVLHIYMLGDMLQGLIHDSLEEADLNPAEAAKALAQVLSGFIEVMCGLYKEVHVYALGGNHGRLTDKIKSGKKSYDFEFLLYSIMEAMLGINVDTFEISTTGMIAAEVGPGVFAGLQHGDQFRKGNKLEILERFRQIGPEVSHLLQGHTHIFSSTVLSTGGYYVCNGSVTGTDSYVHTNGFLPVPAVQVIGRWDANGQLSLVRPVTLT